MLLTSKKSYWMTVADIFEITKLSKLRFYLASKRKDSNETDSDTDLPDSTSFGKSDASITGVPSTIILQVVSQPLVL